MKYYYRLAIHLEAVTQAERISGILGMQPSRLCANIWELEIEEPEGSPYFDFVEYFLGVLGEHIPQLEGIGVVRRDISIWLLYEYDGQCNLEFTPRQLKRLGDEGLSLCESCWDS